MRGIRRRRRVDSADSLDEGEHSPSVEDQGDNRALGENLEDNDIFDFIGARRLDSNTVETGPPDPAAPGAYDRLVKPNILVLVLSFVFFLLGWAAKDTLSTVALCKNHVQCDLDKAYQRHREEFQAERAQREVEREKWAEENKAREQVRLVERQLELERERREREREKEEARRQKALINWAKPQADPHCLRYGTRAWTAKLENIPTNYNPTTACYETKAQIHGRMLSPNFCETDMRAGTFGTWHINFNEAACHPRWSPINDKGCTSQGSGKRKFEAQLEGLRSGDDWKAMCSSTPAEFNGMKFDGPHSCDDQGLWGYKGFWFIKDNICT